MQREVSAPDGARLDVVDDPFARLRRQGGRPVLRKACVRQIGKSSFQIHGPVVGLAPDEAGGLEADAVDHLRPHVEQLHPGQAPTDLDPCGSRSDFDRTRKSPRRTDGATAQIGVDNHVLEMAACFNRKMHRPTEIKAGKADVPRQIYPCDVEEIRQRYGRKFDLDRENRALSPDRSPTISRRNSDCPLQSVSSVQWRRRYRCGSPPSRRQALPTFRPRPSSTSSRFPPVTRNSRRDVAAAPAS